MKRVLYIDFENVSRAGLSGIAKLTKNDLVRIFLGPKCSKMSLIDADMVFHCDATVELITNDQIGKNALDFIIMVHLGYDIAKKAGHAFYIISNDKGYDPAISEMKSMTGSTIERLPNVDAVIARGGEVKTGLFAFLHRQTPVAENATQHEVLGKNVRKTTTRRVVGSGASGKSTSEDAKMHRNTRTQGTRGTNTIRRSVKRTEDENKQTSARPARPVAQTARPVEKPAKQVTEQDEEAVLRKAIETCRTKQEFHNYLAKNLDNKEHILRLYNQGKKQLEVDPEAVRRENADPNGQD